MRASPSENNMPHTNNANYSLAAESFIVPRNVYGPDGQIVPGKKYPDAGWSIEGMVDNTERRHVLVAKAAGNGVLRKVVDYAELIDAQNNDLAQPLPQNPEPPLRDSGELERSAQRKRSLIEALQSKGESLNIWSARDGVKSIVEVIKKSWTERTSAVSQQDIEEIALQNTLHGVEVPMVYGKSDVGDPLRKTAQLIGIYNERPEIAEILVQNNIAGFHGTQSSALFGIVDHGALVSAEEARSKGKVLASGERTYSPVEGQSSISFGDWRSPETIARYAEYAQGFNNAEEIEYRANEMEQIEKGMGHLREDGMLRRNARLQIQDLRDTAALVRENPQSVQSRMLLANFPVALGVNIDDIPAVETMAERNKERSEIVVRPPGDVSGEFMYFGPEIGLDRVRVVAVPKAKIKETQIFLAAHGVEHIEVVDLSVLTRNYSNEAIREAHAAK